MRLGLHYAGACTGEHAHAGPAVEVQGLVVRYAGAPEPALRGISVSVERGERVALVGPNGAGKSTLLQTLASLQHAESGTVRVLGHTVGRCRHEVAYVPQRGTLHWDFPVTVERFVLAGTYVRLGWLRRPRRADRARARAVLEELRLGKHAAQPIGKLSGGQQQRALLARALVQEASLVLLDEPFNALDPDSRSQLGTVLDQLRTRGVTVLVATHEPDEPATRYDRVLGLQGGKVVPA